MTVESRSTHHESPLFEGTDTGTLLLDERLRIRAEADALLTAIRLGERVENFETTLTRSDGSALDASVTLSPLRDAAGNVVGASAIARDITPLKRAQTLDRSDGGIGDGLTPVRKIVELHGGSVEATSDGQGKGSRFRVTLPRQQSAHSSTGSDTSSWPPAMHAVPRRILVVDDQEDAREMLRLLLEAKGHTVLEAPDGSTALTLIESQQPDLAFVDIGLPGMSGYEVAQRIRENQKLKLITLVALTGYGSQSDIDRALKSGFNVHLTKPASMEAIDALLADL